MYWPRQALFDHQDGPIARHIAAVVHDFSGGGSERILIRLANAWAAAGRRITLYCGDESGPLRDMVGARVAVVPIAPRTARGGWSRRRLGLALAAMVRGAPVDAIVGPGNFHAPILRAMLDDLDWDRPAVICKLSNPLLRPDRSRIGQIAFNLAFRRTTRRFDALVAMSPALAAEATILLGRGDIACIGEPSLDAVPAPVAPRAQSGMVVCIGRLAAQKNVALAIDAFARSGRAGRLVILGQGPEEAALKARAARLGVADRIDFAGYVPDVSRYLAEADALLCTSLFEGYPAAWIEALGGGVPVVTTPCSLALLEILADPSFGAVAPARAEALAAALDAVLAERRRPAAAPLAELARRHQLAASARDWLALLDRSVAARAEAMAHA